MSESLLGVYHRLPSPLRSLVANIRGYQLRSWRYGPETDRLIEEAVEREQWSEGRWKEYREEKLAHLLHHAATRVPYYREHWARRRRKGDRSSWHRLENWPILEKEPLRANPAAFLAEGVDVRKMFPGQTSGTTGTPLKLWSSRETLRAWYALFESRSRRWYGVSSSDRWATAGGRMVIPVERRRPPFWVWNRALNQLYMSAYHLAPDLIPYYLDAMKHYGVTFLYAYTSSLYALAQETLRLGRKDLKMVVAIANAEPLFDYQREAISEAFQCPVRETYGMSEMVASAGECSQGVLHVWPEAGHIEVVERDVPVRRGVSGDLVCIGLLNDDMPLIRYRVGDRGALAEPGETCACGSALPILKCIEGRLDDVLYTPDGRRIGRLSTVFKGDICVREAQVIQERLDRVRVRYVPAPGFGPEAERLLIERLQARIGKISVVLEPVEEVPRTSGGKFRAVISQIPREALEASFKTARHA